MINLPRRSVTRFFIPLIDVLTLLFCIFLLMPLIKKTGDGLDSADPAMTDAGQTRLQDPTAPGGKPAKNQPADWHKLVQAEREELERLRKEKMETLKQRLFIRVLEIDADTGKLYYQEDRDRFEVASQGEALRLIGRHRDQAAGRELYYLFLYPRRLTGYPEQGQVNRYEAWFKDVAHGLDNPLAVR